MDFILHMIKQNIFKKTVNFTNGKALTETHILVHLNTTEMITEPVFIAMERNLQVISTKMVFPKMEHILLIIINL